ncbi:MAG: 4-(cytidine 5'-diphospho)-2-C-methyl-D-erythritol kinase [Lachnospiraceae bacterium]|nr:4-(cytidine 5'-diphospho)-2-C-methyl-D-erythritol kinase [Lachnospiraceae bacterium]
MIELRAYCKINLGLDVTGRRDDGYHLVRMIMQSVGIYDVVCLEKRVDDRIAFTCTDKSLSGDDNLCVKAARLLREAAGIDAGVDIHLIKNNPVAAGMAGGSTDAAAVLRGMDELFGLGLDRQQLIDIGVRVGADVPFCIDGGTALCEGIGEVLTPIKMGEPRPTLLIAKPDVAVSTAGIYTRLDAIGEFGHPDIDGLQAAIEAGDWRGAGQRLGNVLELVTTADVPQIHEIKYMMLEGGAYGALMTGSGPTVFGLFENEDAAEACRQSIDERGLCSFLQTTEMIV